MILTVYRILRCNPFCAPGFDPVPDRGFKHHQIPDDIPSEKGILKYRKNKTLS